MLPNPRPPSHTHGILAALPVSVVFVALLVGGCGISGGGGGTSPGVPAKGELDIQNVSVEELTDSSAVITWRTTKEAVGVVRYAASASLTNTESRATPLGTRHEAYLTDLNPETTYYYEILATTPLGQQIKKGGYSFTTPPPFALNDSTPPMFVSVEIRGITSSSALVVWETDDLSWGRIHYGLTTSYGEVLAEPDTPQKSYTRRHSIVLDGLDEDTTYHLRVQAENMAGLQSYSEDQVFQTLKAPTLSIYPESLQVSSDEEFQLALHIEDAVDLAGLAATITYDPNLLEMVRLRPGPFFTDNEGYLLLQDPDRVPGRIRVDASWEIILNNDVPAGTYADGDGDIAVITFRALGPGTVTLNFVEFDSDGDGKPDTRLLDHNRLDISFHTRPGVVIR
jgi:hypothetical protein